MMLTEHEAKINNKIKKKLRKYLSEKHMEE